MMTEELKKRNGTSIQLKDLIHAVRSSGCRAYIPEYQRNYKWKAEGRISAAKLLDDLYHLFTGGSARAEHKSIGLVTLYVDNENQKIHILDGQQRLVTLMLIFRALGKADEFFPIDFQRDELLDAGQTRKRYIESLEYRGETEFGKDAAALSDKRRFQYNYDKLCQKLKEYGKVDRDVFFCFIKEHTCFLLHVSEVKPVDEFLNLNCYKTKFSVSDRMRSRLIVYASFHPEEVEKADILRYVLPEENYKKSISRIFERLSALLYHEELYKLVKRGADPDATGEDRINILFQDLVSDTTNGYMGEIIFHEKDEIRWIVKLTFYLYRLEELKTALDTGDYTLPREIKSLKVRVKEFDFFRMLDHHMERYRPAESKKNILGQILHTTSSLDQLLFEHGSSLLSGKDALVCNTMFHVLSEEKEQRDPKLSSVVADFYRDGPNKEKKPYVVMDPQTFEDTVQTSGKYMLYRYFRKQTMIHNTRLYFPFDRIITEDSCPCPEDENPRSSKTDQEAAFPKQISAQDLLQEKLIIPVIQRDYCLGAHLSADKNNLLSYLMQCYTDDYKGREESVKKTPTLSAITVHKTPDQLFLYDGQQRVVTVAVLLKILGWNHNIHLEFEGRENFQRFMQGFLCGGEKEDHAADSKAAELTSYAQSAVCEIRERIRKDLKKEDYEGFRSFLLNIKFDVVNISGNISTAEQYFMDINDGVWLKPYEIFKCMLNTKVKELYGGQTDKNRQWIHFVENTLTDLFYRWKGVAYNQEEDDHEAAAMQLLEYCLRMMYNDAEIEKNKARTLKDVWKEILSRKSFGKETQMGDTDLFIDVLTSENLHLLSQRLEMLTKEMQVLLEERKGPNHDHPAAAPKIEKYTPERFGNQPYYIVQYQLSGTCTGHAIIKNFLDDLGSFCTAQDGLAYYGSRQFDLMMWTVIENLSDGHKDARLREIIKAWSESRICGPVIFLAPGFIGRYETIRLPVPAYDIPGTAKDYRAYYSEKSMKYNRSNLPAFLYAALGKGTISSECENAISCLFQYKRPYQPKMDAANWQIFYRHFQPNYIRRHDVDGLPFRQPDEITFADSEGSIKIKSCTMGIEFYHHFMVHGSGFKIPTEEVSL